MQLDLEFSLTDPRDGWIPAAKKEEFPKLLGVKQLNLGGVSGRHFIFSAPSPRIHEKEREA